MLELITVPGRTKLIRLSYNSVLFVTSYAYDLHPILVADNFTSGAPWNSTARAIDQCSAPSNPAVDSDLTNFCQLAGYPGQSPDVSQLVLLQNSASSLEVLSKIDCFEYLDRYTSLVEDYNTSGFSINVMTQYKSVLLVSALNQTNAVLRIFNGTRTCTEKGIACTPDNWNVDFSTTDATGQEHEETTGVDYCLAEQGNILPALQCSPQLLGVVALCNLIKLTCLIIALRMHYHPLVTVGDAITSFLRNADSRTTDLGALSARQVKASQAAPIFGKGLRNLVESESSPSSQFSGHHRWYKAVALQRGLISVLG